MAASRPRSTASLRKTRVQHAARIGVEAKGNVGDAEHRSAARQLELDAPHRFERLDGRGAIILLAGGDGQGERVEDQVLGAHAVFVDGQIVNAMGDRHLAGRQ